jgi:hypothetical protein
MTAPESYISFIAMGSVGDVKRSGWDGRCYLDGGPL